MNADDLRELSRSKVHHGADRRVVTIRRGGSTVPGKELIGCRGVGEAKPKHGNAGIADRFVDGVGSGIETETAVVIDDRNGRRRTVRINLGLTAGVDQFDTESFIGLTDIVIDNRHDDEFRSKITRSPGQVCIDADIIEPCGSGTVDSVGLDGDRARTVSSAGHGNQRNRCAFDNEELICERENRLVARNGQHCCALAQKRAGSVSQREVHGFSAFNDRVIDNGNIKGLAALTIGEDQNALHRSVVRWSVG